MFKKLWFSNVYLQGKKFMESWLTYQHAIRKPSFTHFPIPHLEPLSQANLVRIQRPAFFYNGKSNEMYGTSGRCRTIYFRTRTGPLSTYLRPDFRVVLSFPSNTTEEDVVTVILGLLSRYSSLSTRACTHILIIPNEILVPRFGFFSEWVFG